MIAVVGQEAHQHLIQNDIVKDLYAGIGFHQLAEALTMVGAAVDQELSPSRCSHRRINREASGAARELRVPVHLVPLALFRGMR